MGLYRYSQINAWSTQFFWFATVSVFDREAHLSRRETHRFVDHCSACSIDYSRFIGYVNHFLLPNMISALQPADNAVGRSLR